MDIVQALCQEFHLKTQQCENVLRLIDDGNTIPFIARYRKEQTGSLDDQLLREIYERLQYLRGLDKRRHGKTRRGRHSSDTQARTGRTGKEPPL